MDKRTENLFEIEMVQDTSLEAARVGISVPVTVGGGGGDDGDGGGQSNSNCSSNNAADMP